MWLLAQEVGTSPVDWVQYGALTMVVLGLVTGWLWPKPAVDRIIADNERYTKELRAELQGLRAQVADLQANIAELKAEVAGHDART